MDSNDLKNFEILTSIIKEGDVLVDIGANYGDYTNFFKECLNGTGKIYSVELHPDTFKFLQNKFGNESNINVFNYGVSNTNDLIPFYKGNDACTNNIIGHDTNFKVNEKIGNIQGIRLDSLLKEEKYINLLKIDVECAENLVLDGMSGISDRIEYILIENHLDEDWDEIRDMLLNRYNFKCISVINNQEITNESNRQYQCLCTKKIIL